MFEIKHYERRAPKPEAGWIIFVVDGNGETFVDHDWHKGCVYIPEFPPPLWGFFPTYQHAAKALWDLGWIDRLRATR